MLHMFSKSAHALKIAEEARKLAVSNEQSVAQAKRLANEALSRASQCEDRAVKGNEVAGLVNQTADLWWKRWQDVVNALQKQSQDMHELDKRISELEGRRYLAEADAKAKPLIEIVDAKHKAKKAAAKRSRMGDKQRREMVERKLNSGELPRDLYASALKNHGIMFHILALYEITGGYQMHKRSFVVLNKYSKGGADTGRNARMPYGIALQDFTTRKTDKAGARLTRSCYYPNTTEREEAAKQLTRYHELCRAYHTEKGLKP